MNSDFARFIPFVLLVSPLILAILFGIFGNYFFFIAFLLIIIGVCVYYAFNFIKGDVKKKRAILQLINLDLSEKKYHESRDKEIERYVISFLINAIKVSSDTSRLYYEWGERWKIDHWHLVDGMRIYLEKLDQREPTFKAFIYSDEPSVEEMNNARPISIEYKDNTPSIKYNYKRDRRYYQYDIYRAFAKEIVDRHLISRELESIFEDPIPDHCDFTPNWEHRMNGDYYIKPSESKRKAQEDEWKEKRDLYKNFWEDPLDFKYDGNWLKDKDFSRVFATKLWERYSQPLPAEFYDGWENK